jgi:hypothetical protein
MRQSEDLKIVSFHEFFASFEVGNGTCLTFSNFHIFKFARGSSSFGRAIAFQAIGGEFEPRLPLRQTQSLSQIGQIGQSHLTYMAQRLQ